MSVQDVEEPRDVLEETVAMLDGVTVVTEDVAKAVLRGFGKRKVAEAALAVPLLLKALQDVRTSLTVIQEACEQYKLTIPELDIGDGEMWRRSADAIHKDTTLPINVNAVAHIIPYIQREIHCVLTALSFGHGHAQPALKVWRHRDVVDLRVSDGILRRLARFLLVAKDHDQTDYALTRSERMSMETFMEMEDKEKYKRQLAAFHYKLSLTSVAVYESHHADSSLLRYMHMFTEGLSHLFRPRRTGQVNSLLSVNAEEKFLKRMWNLTEEGPARAVLQASFPMINVNRMLQVPRADGTTIPVRLLADFQMLKVQSMGNFFSPYGNPHKNAHDCLVIHFHGGGFVGQSSFSHQIYTRKWAKRMQVPILSVDYRLAPEHKYPAALEDCYDVYKWALQSAKKELGILPRRIILTGDSAGAHLALALTNKLILEDARLPDGIVLAYPAVEISRSFSTSMLYTINDPMVPVGFLELCLEAYLPECPDPTDICLNVAITPTDVLAKYPPLRIMVGEKDPLFDGSLRFAHRLHQNGNDVKLTVYEMLGHGFWSFDSPIIGIEAAKQTVELSVEWIKEFLIPEEE